MTTNSHLSPPLTGETEPAANPGSQLTCQRGDHREGALLALPVRCPQKEARRLCLLAAAQLTLAELRAYSEVLA